ncbi:MAG: hypothetical protein V4482_03590 [Pseudomonadota bacterium]
MKIIGVVLTYFVSILCGFDQLFAIETKDGDIESFSQARALPVSVRTQEPITQESSDSSQALKLYDGRYIDVDAENQNQDGVLTHVFDRNIRSSTLNFLIRIQSGEQNRFSIRQLTRSFSGHLHSLIPVLHRTPSDLEANVHPSVIELVMESSVLQSGTVADHEFPTQQSTHHTNNVIPTQEYPYVRRFLTSCVPVMDKIWSITLNVSRIIECSCFVATYCLVGVNFSSVCSGNERCYYGMQFLAAGMALSLLRNTSTLFVLLRKQLISICELNLDGRERRHSTLDEALSAV